MTWTLLWPRLFSALLLLLIGFVVYGLKRIDHMKPFFYLIGVIIVRDLLQSTLAVQTIFPLSEIIVLTLVLLWLRTYTGRRSVDLGYFITNGLFFAAGMALPNLAPQLRTSLYLNLLVLADVIYLIFAIWFVTPYNTENPDFIVSNRWVLSIGLGTIHLISFLGGYTSVFMLTFFFPVSYLLYAYIFFRYNRQIHEEERQSIAFYSASLESTFQFMENLGNAITAKIDLPQIQELIIASAVKNSGADAGAILMVDDYEDVLHVRALTGVYPPLTEVPDSVRVRTSRLTDYFSETSIAIGETLLGEVVEKGEAVMVRDSRQDDRLKHNTRDDIQLISSLIAVPLVVGERVLGVLSTIKRSQNQFFSEQNFIHLQTFAEYASITIDNIFTYMEVLEKREMEREVDIAADIQQKLLPEKFPELKAADLAIYNLPAKGVSGDYYDIIRLDENRVALVICDVAGKGIPAAMVMIMIRSILHLIVSPERDAATILTWINHGITGRIDLDHFATISILIYDQNNQEITYSNAAHLPLLVYRSNSRALHKVDTAGLPIGVEKDTRYTQKRFKLNEGDLLVLYTDGIVEAMNAEGQQYSLTSLRSVIENNASLPASELLDMIRSDLESFVGNSRQHDDQTLMLMHVN